MIINPILRGFCPDPSIIRAGEDYYIATSTFEWWPGVKLFHSRDLKHWEQIASPLRRKSQLDMTGDPCSGGIWAPCLSYDGKRFYLLYTDVKTKKGRFYNTHNYLVYADDIYGEWSEPVYLNSVGFDPSLFHDMDGKKYLVNMINGFKGIWIQEFDADALCLKGEPKKIFAGSGIGCTEGPHIYHIGQWYYLLTAEGGTGYEHCVTIARAPAVEGPYEVDPKNPMLTSDRKDMSMLQKCGHADIVEIHSGEYYMVHLCARARSGEEACVLGRETAIQRIHLDEQDWFRLSCGGNIAQNETEELSDICAWQAASAAEREDFDSSVIDLDTGISFVSLRISMQEYANVTDRKGFLRIRGRESLNSLHQVSFLGKRQQAFDVIAETAFEFSPQYPEQMAGMAYMYDAMNFYLLGKTVNEAGKSVLVLLMSDMGVIMDACEEILLPSDKMVWLRAQTTDEGKLVHFYWSMDGVEWYVIGASCDTRILTDEHCRGFTGAHFGMYVHDMTEQKAYADFDYFLLKQAE